MFDGQRRYDSTTEVGLSAAYARSRGVTGVIK